MSETWRAEQEEPYCLVIKDGRGARIAEVFLDDAFPLYEEPNATARKRADILAAAPELLSLAREIAMAYLTTPAKQDAEWGFCSISEQLRAEAQALIAKAEGK